MHELRRLRFGFSIVSAFVVAAVVFVLMEPVAALSHRAVMHGFGWGWHRSHHRIRHTRWEKNDLFPLVFAGFTIAVMLVARRAAQPEVLAAAVGVTAYGLMYALVHDVCVHGRLTGGRPVARGRWLSWVAACHAVHHRGNRAPYGFLVPIVPAKHRNAVISLRGVDSLARIENTS